jgi:hypothetical protein
LGVAGEPEIDGIQFVARDIVPAMKSSLSGLHIRPSLYRTVR